MRFVKMAMVAAAMGLAACSNGSTGPDEAPAPQSIQLGGDVRLRLNQSATVNGTDLRVTFVSVPADSRCALAVVCVWAGDAEVRLNLTQNREVVRQVALHSGTDPKFIEYNDFRIELLDVLPARTENRPIRQQDYSVRLRISGR